MSLFRKVRTLLGALAHKPFSPRPKKADLDPSRQRVEVGKHSELEKEPPIVDTERVADLLARQKQDEAR